MFKNNATTFNTMHPELKESPNPATCPPRFPVPASPHPVLVPPIHSPKPPFHSAPCSLPLIGSAISGILYLCLWLCRHFEERIPGSTPSFICCFHPSDSEPEPRGNAITVSMRHERRSSAVFRGQSSYASPHQDPGLVSPFCHVTRDIQRSLIPRHVTVGLNEKCRRWQKRPQHPLPGDDHTYQESIPSWSLCSTGSEALPLDQTNTLLVGGVWVEG